MESGPGSFEVSLCEWYAIAPVRDAVNMARPIV
jgi:hypothetical protein